MWLYSFFSWNYEQGINLPEGRRWHCIAEFTSNLFNFFFIVMSGRRETAFTHRSSSLIHPLLSLGNRLLVFRKHQALETMMMRGFPLTSLSLEDWQHHSWWKALPGPVFWAHPFPSALTHTASFCEPGKCHCDENWSLGRTRLKRPLNS